MKETQYQIKANPSDDLLVKGIFQQAAERYALIDMKVTSRVPWTIANYYEDISGGFAIASRKQDDLILVDLGLKPLDPQKYSEVERFLLSELKQKFGDRMVQATDETYLRVINSLPVTEEIKEFNRMWAKQKGLI